MSKKRKINAVSVFLVAAVFFILTGCAKKTYSPVVEIPAVSAEELDPETLQRAIQILNKIKRIASESSLNFLGRTTMNEAVYLMEIGSPIVPLMIKELKTSSNMNYRFWLVDLLGYMNTPKGIIPLVEVIEDEREDEKVRIRACISIKSLGYPAAVDYLLISRDLVSNKNVLNHIEETIEFLR
ncbi:MAG: HEAT repeat domain-containing protein [Elusimicrobiota bacterium]